jgi:predicted permease
LAFGIGANATVFTIVNALLFRPLPYREAGRLVSARAENQRLGITRTGVTLADLESIRGRVPSLRGAGVVREGDFNITGGDRPRRVRGAVVSAGTLGTLGVLPARGSSFNADDDRPGAPRRVIVSDGLWRSALGSPPTMSTATLRIDGEQFQIVGVMPAGFRFPEQADLWLPVGSAAATGVRAPDSDARLYQLIARLAPGASIATARSEVASVARTLDAQRPAAQRGWTITTISADAERGENARPAVYLLFALVTAVLLVACANLASLLTVRAAGRRRELAIRSALGATHARLVWHGMSESVVLAAAGAALAVVVATVGVRAVRLAFPVDTLPFWLQFGVDARVLVYTLGLSLATTLAFGLVPALWSARRAPAAGSVHGSRSATDGADRGRLGGALVAGQVAVSLVLVVTASLLGAALRSMGTADLGYAPAGLLTTDFEPHSRRYAADDARRTLYVALTENLRAVPGVRAVTAFDLCAAPIEIARVPGTPPQPGDTPLYAVLPDYFETLRVRVVAGRPVVADDRSGSPEIAVVNETFARRHWPNESALGQRVRVAAGQREKAWLTVVGVVADVRRNPADLEREPHLYVAALQFPPRRLQLIVRTGTTPLAAGALIDAARAANPDEPLGPVLTMDEQIGVWTAPSRFFATSLTGFAVVAMLIAAAGVYGVVSGGVATRTREFGIRLALGATPGRVVRMAVRRGARLSAIGAGVGLAGAVGVSQVLGSLPFGVEHVNVAIVGVAALGLVAIALMAAYVPARRAGRVDPVVALSDDA